jgi:cytochrome c oxidase assembly protein subunit 11
MSVRQKNKKLTWILAGVTVGMFGFGFALVPLYNTFCNVLGINGKTAKTAQAVSTTVDDSRWVTMEFIAINSGGVQWKFSPSVQRIKLHPGEMKRLTFYAENYSDHQMVVQAIPSVSPGIAAKYLKKTECFCFTQQTLNSHEAMNMPLLFHLDKDLPKQVKTLTLSYTLYDVTARAKS